MKREYDFSKGQRGKFYRPSAVFHLPVYLKPEIAEFMAKHAEQRGSDLQTMVNDLLRKDISLIQTVTG